LARESQFVAAHLPFDAHEKIEMHAFGFQPRFQVFAGTGAEFHEHFSFQHIHQNAFRMSEPAGLHALRQCFGSLPCEASECVLRKVAWHPELLRVVWSSSIS
jgi:hypothetical protein